ncbi:hypothetical protein LTR66_001273 [Elasticomyces elasticus]|nr:hypothetical protein LTR66_001273 [Elasticomyces elasticus]
MSTPTTKPTSHQDAIDALGPDSYTTHLLEHATPEHLHITTRRLFIGPIPEGWLKSHRKQWYTQYLHINHSSKAPTFSTNSNVSRQRRLTGIDGPSATATFRSSFPQPVGANDEAQTDGAGETEEASASDRPPDKSIPRSRSDPHNEALRQDVVQDTGQSYKTASAASFFTSSMGDRKDSSKQAQNRSKRRSTTTESFVTASDGLLSVHNKTDLVPETPCIEASNVMDADVDVLPGASDARTSSTIERRLSPALGDIPYDTTSATSLLHSQRKEEQKRASTKLVGAAEGRPRDTPAWRASSDRPAEASTIDAGPVTNRLSGGLVRFNVPESQSQKTELQMRARLVQAGRKRLPRAFARSKLKEGEIVKMEKMLVRVDVTTGNKQPSDEYDENESQKIETRTLEKWREFMAVCREKTEDDATFTLQMYKTRVIPASTGSEARRRFAHEILLSPSTAKINLFSPLDKTLAIWTPRGSRFYIYYLRPRSSANSVEWYTFLRSILGWHRASTLQVTIPDLRVNLRLEKPFEKLESSHDLMQAAEGDVSALEKTLEAERAIAGQIIDQCMSILKLSTEWSDVIDTWAEHERVGLAWKRYDRLEWIHGVNERKMYGTIAMQKTHDLELRPKLHYPTTVRTRKGQLVHEPPPVEGFLIRLTSQKGTDQKMGKLFFKRLYFTTHNQYIFFLRPAKASPPPPPRTATHENGLKIPTAQQIADAIPLIYSIGPYPVINNQVAWMAADRPLSAEETQKHDQDAYDEAHRNVNALLNCDGFVHMCDIIKVRKVHRGATPADDTVDEGSDVDWDLEVEDTRQEDGATTDFSDDRTFELLLKNGLVIRLQAFDKTTKKEWMHRLRSLINYWQYRAAGDIALYKSVRQENLTALGIDERAESFVGQFARKWEVGKSFASPELYNLCGISCCRTIHLSGVLFRKPRRHSTFSRCHVILAHGHLLIFKDTLRTQTGKRLVHIHHERIASMDLKDCYLYAGLITENDLLYQNRTFDANMPGHSALPRIYLEDGWTSTDEDAMTTFVIWHSQSKGWFRGSGGIDDIRDAEGKAGKRQRLMRVSKLGVKGRSIVFKARSRAERDHWVLGIGVEIERLMQGEEVRIVNGRK